MARNMIYTIGNKTNYLKAMERGPVNKVGKATIDEQRTNWSKNAWINEDYGGGYAFQTYADAQRRIEEAYPDRGFAVFELAADWDKDTYGLGDYWHYLLKDVPIIGHVE